MSTASSASSGISQSASSDGPPRSPAPANAFRRTGPKRAKSTSLSSGLVVFVVRFFTFGCLSCADDANRRLAHFRVDDIENASALREADENEASVVESVRIVSTERVGKRRLRLVERHLMLSQVDGSLLAVPNEAHDVMYDISSAPSSTVDGSPTQRPFQVDAQRRLASRPRSSRAALRELSRDSRAAAAERSRGQTSQRQCAIWKSIFISRRTRRAEVTFCFSSAARLLS